MTSIFITRSGVLNLQLLLIRMEILASAHRCRDQ